jgi:sucrose-6F-phosphate phosphohydrolase
MEFNGAPRLMIVSDLDNTMVDHQDHENKSLLRFDALWEAEYNHDSLLVFSTGRSPHLYFELRSHVPLLTPGIAIMSVGTEIKYGESMVPDHGWEQELNEGWDRDAIVEEATKLNLKFQVESEQRPHKVSFYVEKMSAQEVLATLNERFKARGLNPKLIYSGGVDLDILPQGAGKGQALAYLMRKFKAEGRTPGHTLVCGDSGNDAELFAVADVSGVIVRSHVNFNTF